MLASRNFSLGLAVLFIVGGAPACSDPSNETPISLPDGSYTMTPGNAQFFAERVCLSGSDEEKIDKLVSKGLSFGQDCVHKPAMRAGNVVSGTNNCTVGSGKGITTYNGEISAEGMQLSAKLQVLNAQGVMNEGAEERKVPTFEIRRTGNC